MPRMPTVRAELREKKGATRREGIPVVRSARLWIRRSASCSAPSTEAATGVFWRLVSRFSAVMMTSESVASSAASAARAGRATADRARAAALARREWRRSGRSREKYMGASRRAPDCTRPMSHPCQFGVAAATFLQRFDDAGLSPPLPVAAGPGPCGRSGGSGAGAPRSGRTGHVRSGPRPGSAAYRRRRLRA